MYEHLLAGQTEKKNTET